MLKIVSGVIVGIAAAGLLLKLANDGKLGVQVQLLSKQITAGFGSL